MRTCFEIDEPEEYAAARALLIRRCRQWARRRELPAEPAVLTSALDCRHFSADGRLTYWTPDHVRHFLLEWVPRYLDGDPEELDAVPDVLRTLLRFINDYGLRDPRGCDLADNEAEIDAASRHFPDALRDPNRYGVGKSWGRAARDHGVDPDDPQALDRFHDAVFRGDIPIDDELRNQLLAAEAWREPPGTDRTIAQLPVSLPSVGELTEVAAASPVVPRLIAVAEWVGPDGRDLDADGNLVDADAADLAADLASADDTMVNLYVLWAKRMRLIRRYRGRLVRVARAAALVSDPLAVWRRAFETLDGLGEAVCRADEPSFLSRIYRRILPEVLNSLYSLPEPMPVPRLEQTLWRHGCGRYFDIDALPSAERARQYRLMCRDLTAVRDLLGQMGAAASSVDLAHPMFRRDLDPANFDPDGAFDPEATAELAQLLDGPVELVGLTDLATAVLRDRMLAEGREAGLVGELAEAEGPEMLGVVTQHYPPGPRLTEVHNWLMNHHMTVESLLNMARSAPLRSRAAAIVELVFEIEPRAPKLLRRMRSDPELAPSALVCLLESGTLELLDLTDPERELLTAESSLRLLELDGPESVVHGLEELPRADARAVVERVLRSGHPDTHGLAEFRELVAVPFTRRIGRSRPAPPRTVPPHRLGATRRARLRRGDPD